MALSNVNTYTSSRRRFVLVADSDVKNLLYTSTLLKRFQYDVCTARTGTEAFEMATVITPVLIVVSQSLDDMSGLDLIRKIRGIESARNVSIIVLSAKKDRVNERSCLEAGAVACLPAPAAVEDLYRVVQIAIEPVPRMNVRIKTKLPVSINSRAVNCEEGGCARALSEYGLYVRTTDSYPLNTKLPIRIHLDDAPLSAEAVVIYNHEAGNGQRGQRGLGLQFEKISPHDRQRLRLFINNEITKGIEL